jgi:UrcA family protein
MKKPLALALASAFTAASAPAATAMPDYRETSAVVPYHDLDLSTPEGLAQLDKRITSAARRLCSSSGPPTLQESRMTADCIEGAKARAARDVVIALGQVAPRGTDVALVRIVSSSLRP